MSSNLSSTEFVHNINPNTKIYQNHENQRHLALRYFLGQNGHLGFTAAFGLIRDLWTCHLAKPTRNCQETNPGELQTAALQLALTKCNANQSKYWIDKWLKWYRQIFVELVRGQKAIYVEMITFFFCIDPRDLSSLLSCSKSAAVPV